MLIHRMITKQVKNKQIKRKRVNVFKFQENKFQIVQNNLQEIKMILIKKKIWKNHQLQWSLHDKYGQSKAKDWQ